MNYRKIYIQRSLIPSLLGVTLGLTGLFNTPSLQAAACGFNNPGGVLTDFGVYAADHRAPIRTISTIDFFCRPTTLVELLFGRNVRYSIAIDEGNSGNFDTRQMRFAGRSINYNLYVNPGYNRVIGNGANGSGTRTLNGVCRVNSQCDERVYAEVDGGQIFTNGRYTDTVLVTLTF